MVLLQNTLYLYSNICVCYKGCERIQAHMTLCKETVVLILGMLLFAFFWHILIKSVHIRKNSVKFWCTICVLFLNVFKDFHKMRMPKSTLKAFRCFAGWKYYSYGSPASLKEIRLCLQGFSVFVNAEAARAYLEFRVHCSCGCVWMLSTLTASDWLLRCNLRQVTLEHFNLSRE